MYIYTILVDKMIAVMKNQMIGTMNKEDGIQITMPQAAILIVMERCTFMKAPLYTLNGILNTLVVMVPN